jgi:hypothetical protein
MADAIFGKCVFAGYGLADERHKIRILGMRAAKGQRGGSCSLF